MLVYIYQTGWHHIPEVSVLIIFIPTYFAYLSNSLHEILRI